jgi:hypothetical protein
MVRVSLDFVRCSKVLGQRIVSEVIAGIGVDHARLHHEGMWKRDT